MNLARISPGPLSGFVTLVVNALLQFVFDRRVRPLTSLLTGLGVGAAVGAVDTLARKRFLRHVTRLSRFPGTARSAHPIGPPPALRQLLRVIPAGQSQLHGGTEVTLLSLEVYAEGNLLNLRVVSPPERVDNPPVHWHPQLALKAVDDRGNQYSDWWPGGGTGDGRQTRSSYLFTPSLDPAAKELTVEVLEVVWRQFGREKYHEEVQKGPLTFTVILPG